MLIEAGVHFSAFHHKDIKERICTKFDRDFNTFYPLKSRRTGKESRKCSTLCGKRISSKAVDHFIAEAEKSGSKVYCQLTTSSPLAFRVSSQPIKSTALSINKITMRAYYRLLARASSGPGKPVPMNVLPPIPLYRRLFRAHRTLPGDMRLLGDEYVKAEFRAHREVENPLHIVRIYTCFVMVGADG